MSRRPFYKYLGVYPDQSLSFNEHVPRLVNKVSRQLGLLIRVTMQLKEGRTGVLSRCMISSFLFSVKREFRKLFFMTRDLKALHDP